MSCVDSYIGNYKVKEIFDWAVKEYGDEDLLYDILEIVANNRGNADIGAKVDARITDCIDAMEEGMSERGECGLCHGSGGCPPELPCIRCGGSGKFSWTA